MKTTKRTNGSLAFESAAKVDLTREVCDILKTMIMLERPYGLSYLSAVVQGRDEHSYLKPEHQVLETYGALKHRKWDSIRNILLQMYQDGLIINVNKVYNTFETTPIGRAFLDSPSGFEMEAKDLVTPRYDLVLLSKLRALRKRIADDQNLPSYRILAEFSLLFILKEKPATFNELQVLPGIGISKAEKYGAAILTTLKKVEEERAVFYLSEKIKAAKCDSYQMTKALFQRGLAVKEMAVYRQLKESTIQSHLECLHIAGEIDIRPMIEKQLNSKDLYKGAEYFRSVSQPKLKEAFEVLGLNYDTLRLCKLYVSDVKSGLAQIQTSLPV